MPQALLFSCTVLGKPEPAGSKRGFVNKRTGAVIITDANKNAKSWQQQVAGMALSAVDLNPFSGCPELGALSLVLKFYLARPKGHYGTGKNAGVVKDSAPRMPIGRPDASKLVRGVEDALTGIVWRDDAQITYQVAAKLYGLPERVEIRVYG